jgi:hypothetical protein
MELDNAGHADLTGARATTIPPWGQGNHKGLPLHTRWHRIIVGAR